MGDRADNDLSYGHYGDAIYDTDEQKWHFERLPNQAYALEPLGEPKLVVEPSLIEIKASDSNEFPSTRCEKQIKDLVKQHPEVQPATDLLTPLLRISEAVEQATARHDTARSSLLSSGSIYSESAHRCVPVIVHVSGPTGSDLRVVQEQTQRRGWSDSRDAWLEVPSFTGDEIIWHSEGAPIQQVMFAHLLEDVKETWLAVRLIMKTLIFRPILRKKPVSDTGSSRLDLNCIFEVPIEQTGGVLHADVAVNPWFTRQFALIDQAGYWSIWEYESRRKQAARFHRQCQVSPPERNSSTQYDGWARICWLLNPSTIAVCTRRKLLLFDISGNEPDQLQTDDVGLADDVGWITDMVPLPTAPDHLCVLTSTHLLVLQTMLNRKGAVSMKSAARIRHFRSSDDLSIRLSIFADRDGFDISIRSSYDPVILAYRLAFSDTGKINVADPTELQMLPGTIDVISKPLRYNHNASASINDTAMAAYQSEDVRFFSIITLSKDLALRQQMYFARRSREDGLQVRVPEWESSSAAKTAHRAPKDGFIVMDDEAEVQTTGSERNAPLSRYVRRRMEQRSSRDGSDWTVDYQLSVHELQITQQGKAADAQAILQQARHMLELAQEEEFTPMQTLRELIPGEISVSDIEQATAQLHDLALLELGGKTEHDDELRHVPELVLRQVPIPFLRDQAEYIGDVGLGTMYDNIVADWITPLSEAIPARVRLAKEQSARRMATEVTLASHVLRRELPEQQPESQPQQTKDESQVFELPVRGAYTSQAIPSSQRSVPGSQPQPTVLPTPSPTATPSITTASSHPSSFAAPEVSRLSRYTTFTKSAPSALPRGLRNVLSHWTIGADPADYDWLSTSRNISSQQEAEDEDSQLTEKQRARLQRKAERHIRRQRKEAAASQASQLASSQMPELVVSASQPAVMSGQSLSATAGGSSQSLGIGQVTASQAVAGRYGGRPPARKKRKSGF